MSHGDFSIGLRIKIATFHFLHLMTFLVPLTSHFVLPLEMSGCLDHLAYKLATIKVETGNPSVLIGVLIDLVLFLH